jgi:hypothetical protein
MKNILQVLILLLVFNFGFSQDYAQIPETHLKHPELYTTLRPSDAQGVDYELIHLRSKFSKTFLNTNTTKTTVQSSNALHHQDKNGFWLTIDNKIAKVASKLQYPSVNPTVQFDTSTRVLSLFNDGTEVKFRADVQFLFLDYNNQIIKTLKSKLVDPKIESSNNLNFNEYLQNINKNYTFYNQAIKSDYIIKSKAIFPEAFKQMVIEEIIDLPQGFSIKQAFNAKLKATSLTILDATQKAVFSFNHPIVSDAKPLEKKLKHSFEPQEAFYEIIQISENSFKIKTVIDENYLTANERVFPITIDPVIAIENNNINLPTKQSSSGNSGRRKRFIVRYKL